MDVVLQVVDMCGIKVILCDQILCNLCVVFVMMVDVDDVLVSIQFVGMCWNLVYWNVCNVGNGIDF